MSLYQVQQCLFDYLRVLKDPKTEGRPEIDTEGYDLSEYLSGRRWRARTSARST